MPPEKQKGQLLVGVPNPGKGTFLSGLSRRDLERAIILG